MPIFIEISTRSKKRLIPLPPQPGPGYEMYSGPLYCSFSGIKPPAMPVESRALASSKKPPVLQ